MTSERHIDPSKVLALREKCRTAAFRLANDPVFAQALRNRETEVIKLLLLQALELYESVASIEVFDENGKSLLFMKLGGTPAFSSINASADVECGGRLVGTVLCDCDLAEAEESDETEINPEFFRPSGFDNLEQVMNSLKLGA